MKRLAVPTLALALVAGAHAEDEAARRALQAAYDEVFEQTARVAVELEAAEALDARARAVQHDIRVWNYRDRKLDVARLPALLPRALEAGHRGATSDQRAAAVFLEAAPAAIQREVNGRIDSAHSSGKVGFPPFIKPISVHTLWSLRVEPLRTEAGVSLDVMTLLQQAEDRREAVTDAVAAAAAYAPEVERRGMAPNRWTNQPEWERLAAAFEAAQERYHQILDGIRAAAFLEARGRLARHLVYEERVVDAGRGALGRFFLGATRTERRVVLPGPGFDDLAGGGTGDGETPASGELRLTPSDLVDLLPEPVRAAIQYRTDEAYDIGQAELYDEEEARKRAEEEES